MFAGAAWILFRKSESDVEILNDVNTDLVTLYRVIKHHLEEFIRYYKWILVARDEFERFKVENPQSLTDIQRAVRFYYLMKTAYGSRLMSPPFSISTSRNSNLNLLRIEEELSMTHLRLSRVYIENSPYERILQRFDKPHTFFYLDPPYWGYEDYYGKGIFNREDFDKLATLFKKVRGKFMMSINDTPEIRSLFGGFHVKEVKTVYNAGGAGHKKQVTELLIMNYSPSS